MSDEEATTEPQKKTKRQRALLLSRRLRKKGKTLTQARKERRSRRRGQRSRALTAAPAQALVDSVLSVSERHILRLANVERVDPHEIAEVMNSAQATDTWDIARVTATLERAREKLTRAGELEAARPSAYVAEDARARYDSIVRALRGELAKMMDADSPLFIMPRAKLLKTIAEVERMRDDALLALTGKGMPLAAAAVYVSHLREPAPGDQGPRKVLGPSA